MKKLKEKKNKKRTSKQSWIGYETNKAKKKLDQTIKQSKAQKTNIKTGEAGRKQTNKA